MDQWMRGSAAGKRIKCQRVGRCQGRRTLAPFYFSPLLFCFSFFFRHSWSKIAMLWTNGRDKRDLEGSDCTHGEGRLMMTMSKSTPAWLAGSLPGEERIGNFQRRWKDASCRCKLVRHETSPCGKSASLINKLHEWLGRASNSQPEQRAAPSSSSFFFFPSVVIPEYDMSVCWWLRTQTWGNHVALHRIRLTASCRSGRWSPCVPNLRIDFS